MVCIGCSRLVSIGTINIYLNLKILSFQEDQIGFDLSPVDFF